jgi:hypothetical protein
MQLFACRGDAILHTLSPQELPLELISNAHLSKFGYATKVETPDGKLHTIKSFTHNVLTTDNNTQIHLH